MAKFDEIYETTQNTFNKVLDNTMLPQFVDFKLLSNDKQKQIIKVFKAGEILNHMTNIDIFVVLNEGIFDQLEEDQQLLVVEEALAYVYYDGEKDTLKILRPDLTTFSGIIAKHGIDSYMSVKESITTLYAAKEEEK